MRPLSQIAFAAALIFTLACNTLQPRPPSTQLPDFGQPASRGSPLPGYSPTRPPDYSTTPTPTDLYLASGDVVVHPDPKIYSGDKVSFEVVIHDGAALGLKNFPVALYRDDPDLTNKLAAAQVVYAGMGERLQATFTWVWDTTEIVGRQTFTVVVDPDDKIKTGDENEDNNRLTFSVNVLPRVRLLPAEQNAKWLTTESACCLFRYISGSAAERDIASIKVIADRAVDAVRQKMGRKPQRKKLEINLINRLLGQGGFASGAITLSYVDRDYAGGGLEIVFRHEAAHMINRQLGGQRPALIEEGAATYLAGGHFKEEPFEPRVVGLLALNRYIPLKALADDFYDTQHEIGYLEGAAFISYLVDSYGWEKFKKLLGAFQSAKTESARLDGGLRLIYSETLAEMESDWLAHLRAQPVDERWQADIVSTVDYLDTVRRYQRIDDPSAYFLTAWIPNIDRAIRQNITADYNRHPNSAANIALEMMLVEVDRAIGAADFARAQHYLKSINAVLAANNNFQVDSLAADYFALTRAILQAEYEPQYVELSSDAQQATVTVWQSAQPASLIKLPLTRVDGLWQFN